jgi:hypothetical protein
MDPFNPYGSGLQTFDPFASYTLDTEAADYADTSCPIIINRGCA